MNLHYGCGLAVANGWFHCDASPTLRLQRLPLVGWVFRRWLAPNFPRDVHYGDIVAGLPIATGSCEAVYCCHVLEHLSLEDLRIALRNTQSYLKAGGMFRLVVPDFEQQVAAYLRNADPDAVSEFMTYSSLGRKTRARGIRALLRAYLGNSYHLWGWDYKGIASELQAAGFNNIRRCQFGDATNPAFSAVENSSRFEWSLAIECVK